MLSRFAFHRLAWLLSLVLLSSCDREAVNAREQSGVWTIRRVTSTFYDAAGTVLTQNIAVDAGEVAFINITGQAGSTGDEARFYFDKDIESRLIAGLMGNNGGAVSAGTTLVTEWLVDQHERRRIILRPGDSAGPFRALLAFVFTLAAETSTTQRWSSVRIEGNSDVIRYREEWEMVRQQ